MDLFNARKKHAPVVLVDIDASSIGAALAEFSKSSPTVYYTIRIPIDIRKHEDVTEAMTRTLEEVCHELIAKGAPVLRKAVGSGHVQQIIVSVGAPWQKTKVRTESIHRPKPFIFTHTILSEVTRKPIDIPQGFLQSGESVIAILLNGYEMLNPFGKRATRADLIVLTSWLEKSAADSIERTLRKTYHTHALTISAFAPIVYRAFRDLFAHEKNYLVMHVSSQKTDIAFIKGGLLVDVISSDESLGELLKLPDSTHQNSSTPTKKDAEVTQDAVSDTSRNILFNLDAKSTEKVWLEKIRTTLSELSMNHALPRTIFLLADNSVHAYLSSLLNAPELRSLWLTDEPLRIIALLPSHVAPFIQIRGDAENDLSLSLLALFGSNSDLGTSK